MGKREGGEKGKETGKILKVHEKGEISLCGLLATCFIVYYYNITISWQWWDYR